MKISVIVFVVFLIMFNVFLLSDSNRTLFRQSLDNKNLSCNIEELIYLAKHADKLQHLEYLYLHINLQYKTNPKFVEFNEFQIPSCIGKFKSIKTLIIKFDNYSPSLSPPVSLPQELSKLQNLQTVDLSNLRLKKIPAYFSKLSSLKTIDLSGNELKFLPENLWEFSSLESLILDKNNLVSIPESICNMKKLTYLNLKNNDLLKIINIPECLFILRLDENKEFNLK